MEQTRVLGSVFYVTPGTTYTPFTLLLGLDLSNAVLRDVAMVVPPGAGSKRPFLFQACPSEPGGLPCSGNVCENCLAVHDGGPGINEAHSGWTLPGLHQGKGLAAATGGESPFTLLPGLCQRYVGGQLTDQPLWPWPMDQRDQRGTPGVRPASHGGHHNDRSHARADSGGVPRGQVGALSPRPRPHGFESRISAGGNHNRTTAGHTRALVTQGLPVLPGLFDVWEPRCVACI